MEFLKTWQHQKFDVICYFKRDNKAPFIDSILLHILSQWTEIQGLIVISFLF